MRSYMYAVVCRYAPNPACVSSQGQPVAVMITDDHVVIRPVSPGVISRGIGADPGPDARAGSCGGTRITA